MVKCRAYRCDSDSYNKTQGLTFHRFPKSENIRRAWIEKMKMQYWQPRPTSVLCSKHFEDRWIERSVFRKVLRPGAIPTLFNEFPRPGCIVSTPEEEKDPVQECRSCLQALSKYIVSYNIFEPLTTRENEMGNCIAKDLANLANVQISETDTHSKLICATCYEQLRNACKFKSLVKRNDQILRQRNTVPRRDVNSSTETVWPKPIQVDKSIITLTNNENLSNLEIKQEVKDECPTTGYEPEEERSNVYIIKIEPEEIIQQQPPSIQTIANASLPVDNSNIQSTGIINITGEDNEKVHVIAQPSYKPVNRKRSSFQLRGNSIESTKASTTEVQTITSRKKTNAQKCREYRERKKLQNTMGQNITAKRSDKCSENDQLQAKKPKTNAERRKKHYEAQKLKKQASKKIPKTVKQKNKEYYDRKKKIQALNTLNHHSDALSKYNNKVNELKCALCDETFMDNYYMKIHQDIHHSNIEENVDGNYKHILIEDFPA